VASRLEERPATNGIERSDATITATGKNSFAFAVHEHASHTLAGTLPAMQPSACDQTPQQHGTIVATRDDDCRIIHDTTIEIANACCMAYKLTDLVAYTCAPQLDALVFAACNQSLIIVEVALDYTCSMPVS
jgi:hypothetical protein